MAVAEDHLEPGQCAREQASLAEAGHDGLLYGPKGGGQVTLALPFAMRIAWHLDGHISRFSCHGKVRESLERIFVRTLDHYMAPTRSAASTPNCSATASTSQDARRAGLVDPFHVLLEVLSLLGVKVASSAPIDP